MREFARASMNSLGGAKGLADTFQATLSALERGTPAHRQVLFKWVELILKGLSTGEENVFDYVSDDEMASMLRTIKTRRVAQPLPGLGPGNVKPDGPLPF